MPCHAECVLGLYCSAAYSALYFHDRGCYWKYEKRDVLYHCGPGNIGQASCDPSSQEESNNHAWRFRLDTEIPALAPKTPHLQKMPGVPELGHLLLTPAHGLSHP